MFGSGVVTGMVRITISILRQVTPRGRLLARIACCVVAAGITMREAAVCRFGTAMDLAAGASTLVSVLPFPSKTLIHPQHNSGINIQFAADLTASFERGFALAGDDFANTSGA